MTLDALDMFQTVRCGGEPMSVIMEEAREQAAAIMDRAAEQVSALLADAARQEVRAKFREVQSSRTDGAALHHNPAIDKKYRDRLSVALRCRDILAGAEPFEFEACYGASPKPSTSRHSSELLADMAGAVIANPHHNGSELGRPFGRGATWFNTVFRKGVAATLEVAER